MKNKDGRYVLGMIMTVFSMAVFLLTAALVIMPAGTTDSGDMGAVLLFQEIGNIAKANGMAYMHMIVLNIAALVSIVFVAAAAAAACVGSVIDLKNHKCSLENASCRMAGMAGAWFFSYCVFLFYGYSYSFTFHSLYEKAGMICIGGSLLCMVLAAVADLRRMPVKMYVGRIVSLLLFLMAVYGIKAVTADVVKMEADSEKEPAYTYTSDSYSAVSLAGDSFLYIQQVFDEENEAVDMMKEKSKEIDERKEAGETVSREEELAPFSKNVDEKGAKRESLWKYSLALGVLAVFIFIMIFAYTMSMRNFARGMCGNKYRLIPQYVWCGLLAVSPFAISFIMKRWVLSYINASPNMITYDIAFYLPVLCAVLFAALSFAKGILDTGALRMSVAMENINEYERNDSGKSVQHYQQMFGDKPLAEFESAQGYQPYQENEGEKKTYQSPKASQKTDASYYQASSEGSYYQSGQKDTAKKGTKKVSRKKEEDSLLGELPLEDKNEEKKIVPKSRTCLECGAENPLNADYCSVCRKRLEG